MKYKKPKLTLLVGLLLLAMQPVQASTVYKYIKNIRTLVPTPASAVSPAGTPPKPVEVPLTKHADISTTSIDFGDVEVGSSKTLRILLSSSGTGPIALSAAMAAGEPEFSIAASDCSSSLASLQICETYISFAPTDILTKNGALAINTDAQEGSFRVSLTGKGLLAIPVLTSQDNADFGDVLTTTTASKLFTLTNTGNKSLSGLYPAVTEQNLQISATTCGSSSAPISLAPNESCSITVVYAPTSRSTLSQATLAIAGQSKTLTGKGVAPVGALSANTSADFSTVYLGASSTKVFTYTNSGDSPAINVKPTLTGTGLSISNSTCGSTASPASIPANGGTCTVSVSYAPTVSGALSNATLAINGSHASASASIAITGSSQEAPPAASDYVLLLHGEGTNGAKTTSAIVDSSPSPMAPSSMGPTGVVTIDTSSSKLGSGSIRLANGWNDPSWGSSYIAYPVQTGGVRRFSLGANFTVESFVKSSSFGCYGAPYFAYEAWDSANNAVTPSWKLYTTKQGNLVFTVYNDNGSTAYSLTSSNTLSTGVWNHIGVSRKNGTVRLFINGVEVASGTYTGGLELTRFYSDIPLIIGQPLSGGSGCFSGVHNFDEVRILKGYGATSLPVPTTPYTP